MITELIQKIRTAVLGREVKEAIAGGLEQIYKDALTAGNTGVEVSLARGNYDSLADRLDAEDTAIQEANAAMTGLDGFKIVASTTDDATSLSEGQILIVYAD